MNNNKRALANPSKFCLTCVIEWISLWNRIYIVFSHYVFLILLSNLHPRAHPSSVPFPTPCSFCWSTKWTELCLFSSSSSRGSNVSPAEAAPCLCVPGWGDTFHFWESFLGENRICEGHKWAMNCFNEGRNTEKWVFWKHSIFRLRSFYYLPFTKGMETTCRGVVNPLWCSRHTCNSMTFINAILKTSWSAFLTLIFPEPHSSASWKPSSFPV